MSPVLAAVVGGANGCTVATAPVPSGDAASPDDAAANDSGPSDGSVGVQCEVDVAKQDPGGQCGQGCLSVPAQEYVATKNCRRNGALCIRCDSCGGGTNGMCFKNIESGALVNVSSWVLQNRAGWVQCSQAERDAYNAAELCAD